MSTQPITSSSYTNANSGYNLSSLNNSSDLQVTGLASGLNTNAIIQALVSIDQQPITNLTNQQSGLTATNQQLTSIQTALQQLVTNAKALGSSQLFANAQTVTSSNPAVVSASAPSGVGAVVGGYQVSVSTLHDFVRSQLAELPKRRRSPAVANERNLAGTPVTTANGTPDAVQERILALKRRCTTTAEPVQKLFHYDPDEPLICLSMLGGRDRKGVKIAGSS